MKVYLIKHVKTQINYGCFEDEDDARKYIDEVSVIDGNLLVVPLEVEPSSKKVHPIEWKPSSQHYRQVLLSVYKDQDLTPEDFADTLNYFEKLVREEAEPLPKEINPDDFTPEQQQDVIQALNDTPRPLNMNGVDESIEFDASQFLERPPLGITPRLILKDRRIVEIAQAIIRYGGVNKTIPSEWITELKELTC